MTPWLWVMVELIRSLGVLLGGAGLFLAALSLPAFLRSPHQ